MSKERTVPKSRVPVRLTHRPLRGESQSRRAKKRVRSVFYDLLEDRAAEMEMRSLLLSGLGRWLADLGMTQTEAAKMLGLTQARVSDLKHGKISQFSFDLLVRLAARAGLDPKLKIAA